MMAEGEQKQKRTLRKLACRGGGLDPPLDAPSALALQRLRKAEKDAPPAEKPEVLKTRRRDTSLLPETVGSVAGPEMTATTRRVLHHLQAREAGPPGIGATHSSRLIPLE
ncbi:hypothetical protein AB1E18_019508 [Capra hircus]